MALVRLVGQAILLHQFVAISPADQKIDVGGPNILLNVERHGRAGDDPIIILAISQQRRKFAQSGDQSGI